MLVGHSRKGLENRPFSAVAEPGGRASPSGQTASTHAKSAERELQGGGKGGQVKVPSPQSKVNEWKPLGLLMSKVQDLYATVRDTLGGQGIGMDIIPWLAGDGKKSLVEKLKALGMEFNNTQRIRLTGNKNLIWVNLDAPPKLPFDGAEVVENPRGGWVKVERRRDKLYVDRREIVPCVIHWKDHERVTTMDHRGEHPNVLDALMRHRRFIPDMLRQSQDYQGNTISIRFGAVKFCGPHGGSCIRSLYSDSGGQCRHGEIWLDELQQGQGGRNPAAVLGERVAED
ncbi:MAG: hypothetical protein Q7S09_01205 [bacterium]|nr:hypothetical protein [bacterium]